jgi:hypothetical protein
LKEISSGGFRQPVFSGHAINFWLHADMGCSLDLKIAAPLISIEVEVQGLGYLQPDIAGERFWIRPPSRELVYTGKQQGDVIDPLFVALDWLLGQSHHNSAGTSRDLSLDHRERFPRIFISSCGEA